MSAVRSAGALMCAAAAVAGALLVAPGAGSTMARSTLTAAAGSSTLALDIRFAGRGVLEFPGWDDVGELVVGGDGSTSATLERRTSGAVVDRGVARVRSDGTLDPTLGAGGSTPGIVDIGMLAGHLTLRADGRFLVGSTQFHADGSVDAGFGVGGAIAIAGIGGNLLGFGNVSLVMFETATHQLVFVSSDGAIYRIGDTGIVVPGPQLSVGGEAARAIPWSNGETLVVTHSQNGSSRIVFVRTDGTLDPTFGDGDHGVSVPGIAASGALLGAAPSPTGGLSLLVDAFSDRSALISVRLDGSRDTSSAPNGESSFDGDGNGLVAAADGGTWVGIWYSFARHQFAPYHPAVVRLTAAGATDVQFNPYGLRSGSVDLTEVGITTDAIARPLVAFGDGLLMGVGEFAPGAPEHLAAIVDLQPAVPDTPPATAPPPPSLPTAPTLPRIDGGAAATRPALRIPPQPSLPR